MLNKVRNTWIFKADGIQHAGIRFSNAYAFISFPGSRCKALPGNGADFIHVDVFSNFKSEAYCPGRADQRCFHRDSQVIYRQICHNTTSSALNTGPSVHTL